MNINKIQYLWPIIINKRLFANITTDPLLGRQLKSSPTSYYSSSFQWQVANMYVLFKSGVGVYNPKTLWKKDRVGAGGQDEIKLIKS
jgi:hypothetical protein